MNIHPHLTDTAPWISARAGTRKLLPLLEQATYISCCEYTSSRVGWQIRLLVPSAPIMVQRFLELFKEEADGIAWLHLWVSMSLGYRRCNTALGVQRTQVLEASACPFRSADSFTVEDAITSLEYRGDSCKCCKERFRLQVGGLSHGMYPKVLALSANHADRVSNTCFVLGQDHGESKPPACLRPFFDA